MVTKVFPVFLGLTSIAALGCAHTLPRASGSKSAGKDASVLILGGGVTGVIAARTLHEQGISDFLIVDAHDEIGGRMISKTFGEPGNQYTVEMGPNWVQGTQTGNGPKNPIWALAQKHDIKVQYNDYDSIKTYDASGEVNYTDVVNDAANNLDDLTVAAGARVSLQQVDTSARTGYSLIGAKPRSAHAMASEYWNWDWEYGNTPEESSWIGASWNNNFTFNDFSDDNLLCIDQRGFKHLIQAEAAEFLQPHQVSLNSTVKMISYSSSGVNVTLTNGTTLRGDYAFVTFSIGVLQNDDVVFQPTLPQWKQEAIYSNTMATYTKIFLQFPSDFWFDTQFALYADEERGRYPVWQSLDHIKFLPGSHIVFVTVTSAYSERVEGLPDSEVQNEVMQVLRAMYPHITVPDPVAFLFPRWYSDPLFRGSYSNWPASFYNAHQENLRATVDGRLWFGGEATSLKYYGFLHGAYFEGLDQGKELAACVNGGGCAGLQAVADPTNAQPYVT